MIENFKCRAITKGLCVTATGKINPCCIIHEDVAIVSDNLNLSSVMVNDNWQRMIEQEKLGVAPAECSTCIHKESLGAISRRLKLNGAARQRNDADRFVEQLDISLSNLCNQKCIMCSGDFSSRWHPSMDAYRKAFPDKQFKLKSNWALTYEQIDQILEKVDERTGQIEIKGGEPTYDKKLEYFIQGAIKKNANIKFILVTNGTRFDADRIAFFNSVSNLTICVSIDAIGDTYSFIRGFDFDTFASSFDLIVKELSRKHMIMVNPTVMTYNVDCIQDLYEWISNVSIKYDRRIMISFSQVVTSVRFLMPDCTDPARVRAGIEQLRYIRSDPMKYAYWNNYSARIDFIIQYLEKSLEVSLDEDQVNTYRQQEQLLIQVRGDTTL